MGDIARRHNVSLRDLQNANPHLRGQSGPVDHPEDPFHWIYPGQTVHIPGQS
jgi:hypothetical protein